MDLTEIQKSYENTYFCEVHKWGWQLNAEEAQKLGLLNGLKEPKRRKTTTKE